MTELTLIRAWPRNPMTGLTEQWQLAGGGNGLPYLFGSEHYKAGISQPARFSASLSFNEKGWSGGVVPSVAAISFQPGNPALLDMIHGLFWKNSAVEVDRSDGLVTARRLTGTIAAVSEADSIVSITVTDLSDALNQPLCPDTFGGTGGIDGESAAEGRVKRRSFGRCFNVEGQLLNTANSIYEFGDPARPMQGCTALRDKGRDGYLQILAWQGSIESTLAALEASEAPAGGGIFAPSIACAKWWTTPSGPLTADIQGEIGSGYDASVAGIAAAISDTLSGPALTDLAIARALRPAEAGWHIPDASTTGASVLDQMLAGAGLFWVLDPTGTIQIREWNWDGDAEGIAGIYLGREAQYAPHKSRDVGYCINNHQHSDGDIAADIPADEVTYADGSTVESMQPAEAGADVTGNNTAANSNALGDVPAVDVLTQLNAAIQQAQQTQDSLNQTAAALQAQADQLQADITANGGDIQTLYSTTATQASSISQNTTAINNTAGALASLTQTVSANSASISQNATAISSTNLQVAGLSSTVSTQGAAISNNQQAISSTNANLSALTTKVVAGGNPNLLPNGTGENGLSGWTVESGTWTVFKNENGTYFVCESDGIAGIKVLRARLTGLTGAKTYTHSYETYHSALSGSGYVDLIARDASLANIYDGPQVSGADGAGWTDRDTRTTVSSVPADTTYIDVRMVVSMPASGGTARFRKIKLEQGSVATTYNDQAAVIQSFTSISSLSGSMASLSSTVSTQGATISSQQVAINTLNGNVTTAFARAALTLDVNGYVTGWETNNSGQTSDFTIRSDRFRLLPPGGSGDGWYFDRDAQGRMVQYLLSGSVRVFEAGYLA